MLWAFNFPFPFWQNSTPLNTRTSWDTSAILSWTLLLLLLSLFKCLYAHVCVCVAYFSYAIIVQPLLRPVGVRLIKEEMEEEEDEDEDETREVLLLLLISLQRCSTIAHRNNNHHEKKRKKRRKRRRRRRTGTYTHVCVQLYTRIGTRNAMQ